MEKLILDLPPSVNKAFMWAPNLQRLVHTSVYRDYIKYASLVVKSYCNRNNVIPIKGYTHMDLHWYLGDKRSDSHNMKKPLFDALEQGGLFENDKWIMDRTQLVVIDKKNPRVEILFYSKL